MLSEQKRKLKLGDAKVLRREDLTPELWIMWLEKPSGYSFEPGQYCTIGLEGIERPYSIVSAPHEPHLELFVELVPEPTGILTPKLWRLKPGDSVTIRPRAKGLFTMEPEAPNQLLVSTVTGVVPYVSFVRDYLHHNRHGHRFYLLHGASYHDEFVYDRELADLASRYADLITYVPTISRPGQPRNNGWQGETGRVNQIVERYVERFGLHPEDTLIYACGNPGMIEDVKEKLAPRGFEVKEERFWKED